MVGMEEKDEWLELESEKSLFADWQVLFLEKNAILIRLYNYTRWEWLARLAVRMEVIQFNWVKNTLGEKAYNSILNEYVQTVSVIIRDYINVNSSGITIDAFSVINGFDQFNAISFPAFGVNYIAVNSGIFFHSHTLVRTLQPFMMDTRLPSIIRWLLIRNFTNSAIGLLSFDHTRSFQSLRLIPEDDGLLEGVELFVVAHEMYHILHAADEHFPEIFESHYSQELSARCIDNEEIGADGFAILVLYYHQMQANSAFLLYAPCFLFKLLSLFDDIMGRKMTYENEGGHPANTERHSYVVQMLNNLKVEVDIVGRDGIIEQIVNLRGEKIRTCVRRILKRRKVLIDTYREMIRVAMH